jgi:uncharacterized protein (DUF433 family)
MTYHERIEINPLICSGLRPRRGKPVIKGTRIIVSSLISQLAAGEMTTSAQPCTLPDILGGMPVFRGTRVPIKNLFDYVESSDTIDNFLSDFPTVKRDQVIEVLETADHVLTSSDMPHENPLRGRRPA